MVAPSWRGAPFSATSKVSGDDGCPYLAALECYAVQNQLSGPVRVKMHRGAHLGQRAAIHRAAAA